MISIINKLRESAMLEKLLLIVAKIKKALHIKVQDEEWFEDKRRW